MNHRWTAHLNVEDRGNFREAVLEAKPILGRLRELLQEDIEATMVEMSSANNYDTPAWAEMQADRLGKLRTLRKVLDLTNI